MKLIAVHQSTFYSLCFNIDVTVRAVNRALNNLFQIIGHNPKPNEPKIYHVLPIFFGISILQLSLELKRGTDQKLKRGTDQMNPKPKFFLVSTQIGIYQILHNPKHKPKKQNPKQNNRNLREEQTFEGELRRNVETCRR